MAVESVKAKINGQTYTLTREGSTNQWKGTITAPEQSSFNEEGGYYPVEITAEDDAGNTKTVNPDNTEDPDIDLELVVKEKVAPIITILEPTSGQKTANKKQKVIFTVTDNDSGVDEDTITLQLAGETYHVSSFVKQSVSGGYRYEYTPAQDLPDDEYTATVNASDNDGNAAAEKSVQFEVYAAAPTLSVISPTDNLVTNQNTVQYQATTNGATLEVRVNGQPQTVSLQGGTATGTLTLQEGTNTIVSTATSETGIETELTRTVKVDTQEPVIEEVKLSKNPADTGDAIVITVTVTD